MSTSASAWHGWSSSVSALITGTEEAAARSTTSFCAKVRMTMRVHVTRQHARRVFDALRLAHLDLLLGQVERHAPELMHADAERDPGASGRLAEDERHRLAGKHRARGVLLPESRLIKDFVELRLAQVGSR